MVLRLPLLVSAATSATAVVAFADGRSPGDEATDRIVAALHGTGRFEVSTTTIDGRATVRFAFLNPATTQARVAEAIEVVERGAGGGT